MNVGDVFRVEITTGGDPEKALMSACAQLQEESGLSGAAVIDLSTMHDDGCPSTALGSGITVCTCEILWLRAERLY